MRHADGGWRYGGWKLSGELGRGGVAKFSEE